MKPKDPHDIRKSSIEDAAIDGEHVPRMPFLCPACGLPLTQSFNWHVVDVVRVYCAHKKCTNSFTAIGGRGRTFDEAAQRLREKVGTK